MTESIENSCGWIDLRKRSHGFELRRGIKELNQSFDSKLPDISGMNYVSSVIDYLPIT
jgi:hypothetical protein